MPGKNPFHPFNLIILLSVLLTGFSYGIANADNLPNLTLPSVGAPKKALSDPKAPDLNASAFILIDANSGKILAEKESQQKIAPASLTKIMTMYIVSNYLKSGRIKLDDEVTISKKAWQTGGSKMFVRAGQKVTIADLIKGIIVDSGNDACVAIAEHIAGSEAAFADIMNQHAKALGMTHSHFTDSTGMPHENHYSSAYDLAILARALVTQFPEDYAWYKQKWFTFNKIKQPNRNRLLWRDVSVDGIKTGHTSEAGYCLVSSAKRDGMRLIAVVMGAPTDEIRAQDSQRLLNFGFHFYKTHLLYKKGQQLGEARIWQGSEKNVPVGIQSDLYVTIPANQYKNLKANMVLQEEIHAPVAAEQKLGQVVIKLFDKQIAAVDLVALKADPKGGLWSRFTDKVRLSFSGWFGSDSHS